MKHMRSKSNSPLRSILHPYIFVLKEGGEIKNDFLDYSLLMFHIRTNETIRSPVGLKMRKKKTKLPF